MAQIEISNRLYLYTQMSEKPRAKQIPGGRWDGKNKRWAYQPSVFIARRIAGHFPELKDRLAPLINLIEQAQYYKTCPAEHLPAQPDNINATMWEHQLRGYAFAKTLPAGMLTMDMGTGKTLAALAVREHRQKKTLVLCPKAMIGDPEQRTDGWAREIHKWLHEPPETIFLKKQAAKKKAELIKHAPDNSIVVINYESAWREPVKSAIKKAGFGMIILDESVKIKSPNGRASWFTAGLGDDVPYRLALTGRPLPHSPMDGYGQLRTIDKGVFGTSFELFRNRYAILGGPEGKWVEGYTNQEDFAARLEEISYTVKSEDVQDLPETQHISIRVEMDPGCRKIYNSLEAEWVAEVEGHEVTIEHCLTRGLRLQQITSGYLPVDEERTVFFRGNDGPPGKRKALTEFMEGLPVGEPVVVFARFTHDIEEVRGAARDLGLESGELTGQHDHLGAWQAGEFPVIAVQISSGSMAIDLTRARYAVYYSIGNSLGDYEQSLKRLHRPGQDKKTFFYHLITKDSIDEHIYGLLDKRAADITVINELMEEIKNRRKR